jgi:uncharacterized protein YraI
MNTSTRTKATSTGSDGARGRRWTASLATVALLVGMMVLLLPSTADAAIFATYRVTTDVSARSTPTAAPTSVYGIPRGAAFGVQCQVIGEPVGPRGNTLYFFVSYQGRAFYVPDTWTDSPHLAGQPPIAGIPMCGASGSRISSNSGSANIRNCPDTHCTIVGRASNGAPVQMRCYRDAQWATGNYSSNRWFYVNTNMYGTIPLTGWVHSSLVANQTGVGRC